VFVPSPSPHRNNAVGYRNGPSAHRGTSIGYINKPCVSVTVCIPGTSTCQTITDIVLDGGDSGLRIFKQALAALCLRKDDQFQPGRRVRPVWDGSSVWGRCRLRAVLGNEPAVQVPVRSGLYLWRHSRGCQNAYQSPLDAGYNGILGVGFFCPRLRGLHQHGRKRLYYTCSGSVCNGTAIPLDQVQNPVSLLPVNNNGVIAASPVPPGGVSSVGWLTLCWV
jgi:hypothetical protein